MEDISLKYAHAAKTYAQAKSAALGQERKQKRVFREIFLRMDGNIEERKAKAHNSPAYTQVEDDWVAAESAANLASAELDALRIVFDEWRTIQATKRAEMGLV